MNFKKLLASGIAFLLFMGVYQYKNHFDFALYQDEIHYYATAIEFSKQPLPSLHLLQTFHELNTPLPFIVGGWVIHIFGENVAHLRLLNFLLSFFIVLLFIWLSPDDSRRFWLCLGGLLVFPNYYLCSIHFYTDVISLLTVLLGMIMYFRKWYWLAGLFFVAAIASRQYMLAFPAAIILYETHQRYRESGKLKDTFPGALGNPALYPFALACLSLLPWMLLWGGPAPTEEMSRQYYDSAVLYNGGFVLYASAALAFYYILPETIFTNSWRYYVTYPARHPRLFVGFTLLVLLLVFFFPAQQTQNKYFDWPFLGYFDRILEIIGISGIFKQLVFGSFMLVGLMRFVTPVMSLSGFLVIINLLLLGKAQLSWDKYLMPTVAVLWFLALFDAHWSLNAYHPRNPKFQTDSKLTVQTK